jgi:hypothetical protein
MASRLHDLRGEKDSTQEDAMAMLPIAQSISLVARTCAGELGADRAWLYKVDHVRHIDRYIDFFGAGPRRDRTTDRALGSPA